MGQRWRTERFAEQMAVGAADMRLLASDCVADWEELTVGFSGPVTVEMRRLVEEQQRLFAAAAAVLERSATDLRLELGRLEQADRLGPVPEHGVADTGGRVVY